MLAQAVSMLGDMDTSYLASLLPSSSPSTTMDRITSTEIPPNVTQRLRCYELPEFRDFQNVMDDILLGASMIATIFNVVVIFCAIKLFRRSGDTMHLFIINMTLGDLLLTIFCHPNEFLLRKHEFLKHVHLCALVHFFNWIGLAVSGLSLTMLNIDKLIYFQWPLSYDRTMSKGRAAACCIFIWSASFGYVGYLWLMGIVYIDNECTLQLVRHKKMYFYEGFMIIFCVLPVLSSLFVSIYLFRLTREKRAAPIGSQTDTAFRIKVRSTLFIFSTTIWTSISLLPYRIFNLGRLHFFVYTNQPCAVRQLINWISWMMLYLLTMNPIINPFITALIYAPYRLAIKKFLAQMKPIQANRPSSSGTRHEQTDTSFLSTRRSRTRRTSSTEQELVSMSKKGNKHKNLARRISLGTEDSDWKKKQQALEEGNGLLSRNDAIERRKSATFPFRSRESEKERPLLPVVTLAVDEVKDYDIDNNLV